MNQTRCSACIEDGNIFNASQKDNQTELTQCGEHSDLLKAS